MNWWRETWGDVVWRHNMLVLLTGLGIVVAVLCVGWLIVHETVPPPFRNLGIWRGLDRSDCPPEWKCNGNPQTNDPRCCL